MTKQLDVWQSQFGVDWTDRTEVKPDSRVGAFRDILSHLPVKSILEVGCNTGYNLIALSRIGNYKLVGIDPQIYATKQAMECGLECSVADCFNLPYLNASFDLVFTVGVLMHVTPVDMPRAVKELCRVSNRYVLVIEYFSPGEISLPWHGHTDLLWKRDYGKSFADSTCIEEGFLGRNRGFDNCTYWLFER